MKRTLLFASLALTATGFAQTFSDNFDSYTAGQYLAQNSGGFWTTWSNAPGGAEDVLVSSANFVSGPNSVYFSTSVDGGGPTDLIRNFGVLNTGQFSMEFNMFIETGKAGYFNLQRNATPGQVWAMDCNFNDDGSIDIVNTTGLNFDAGTFTHNTWFNFRIDINFNTNNWEVFIDNVSHGSFANSENQIASIDIFPVDQNAPFSAGYFIDDFEYTITPYSLPNLNAATTLLSFDQGMLAGGSVTPKVKVRNLGTTAITSFDLDVTYNGNTISKSVTGVNLASLAETTVTMDNNLTLVAGNNNMVATVSNVNGNATDGDAADDALSISLDPLVPAAGKMVVGEEGTGTWCPWCVRGIVFMDMMDTKYPDHWIGIAVHSANGDPMIYTPYEAGLGALVSGYPSALVDRLPEVDPSVMEPDFLDRIVVAPTALITNGAQFDPVTNVLDVSVSANFQSAANNNYKMAVVLTEDGLTGTTSVWAQSNAYAGGGNGPMGGFESMPNPVPAAQMVYDHVARIIAPSFAGSNTMFPASISSGETHTMNYTFSIPAAWNLDNIHIVGMLIAPDGKIDNAGKTTVAEAISNGFVNGTDITGVEEFDAVDATLSIYPNPASNLANISLNLKAETAVQLRLIDMNGKEMAARNYGTLNGGVVIPMQTQGFNTGVYIVELTLNNQVIQKRLIIE